MKYYKISAGSKISNYIAVPNISVEESKSINGINKRIESPEGRVFLNFYENPLPIISNKLKLIVEAYSQDIIGTPLALTNTDLRISNLYWILSLNQVDCKKGSNKIAIDYENIKGNKIFAVKKGLRTHVIVDYDIVELLLRNEIFDVDFEEIIIGE